jgi:putative heme iron utilization protein
MEQRDHVLSEEDADRIIEHMNAEHADDLLLFAQVYAEEAGATAARMTGIDAEGITLQVTMADGEAKCRVDFETPVHTPEDAHRALVDMALNARG